MSMIVDQFQYPEFNDDAYFYVFDWKYSEKFVQKI